VRNRTEKRVCSAAGRAPRVQLRAHRRPSSAASAAGRPAAAQARPAEPARSPRCCQLPPVRMR
jgi:hypothetical protein